MLKSRNLFLFFIFTLLNSYSQILPHKPVYTTKPPVIDGILDDDVWKTAPQTTDFKTFIPDFSKEASQKTIVYTAYDKENIYFAYQCFDKEPEKIKASLTNRDNIRPDDWICVNLDSFNDQQSLYAFYVNPFGIQMDSKSTGNSEDTGMDFIWHSGAKVNQDGYIVEVQIPLKSIRYADTNPVQMAVFFERRIARFSEQSSFPALDPKKGYSFMDQLMPLYYYDVNHYTLFEMIPAFTFNQKYSHKMGSLSTSEVNRDVSLTLKYGITSDLILDGTYNPDFSQVEADAGQVDINLRSKLFNAEKRPFFLEGRDNFIVAGTSINEIDPVASIFHSRIIENPIAGIKLSGKISSTGLISVLYANDERKNSEGNTQRFHIPVIRYKHALNKDSFIGGIAGSVENNDNFNRVFGFDGQLRFEGAKLLEFSGIFSNTGTDISRNINGNSFTLKYSDQTRDLEYSLSAKNVSKDFIADMGYLSRNGIYTFAGLIKPKFYPEQGIIRKIELEAFTSQSKDEYFNMWETFNHISFYSLFPGNLSAKVKYSYSTEIFEGQRFKTGGFHATFGGWFSNKFYFSILYRRVNAIYYQSNPFQGYSNRITSTLLYLPNDNFQTEFAFTFSDFTREDNDEQIYSYPILRTKLTYQLNKYLFFRSILEYNDYRRQMVTDFLASFTYIPGTVMHIGYGSMFEKTEWDGIQYRPGNSFIESRRGFFFKASYLVRL